MLSGFNAGRKVFIPRMTMSPSDETKFPLSFDRRQFPTPVCFAMKINKSQGQSLSHVGLYLYSATTNCMFLSQELQVERDSKCSYAIVKVRRSTRQQTWFTKKFSISYEVNLFSQLYFFTSISNCALCFSIYNSLNVYPYTFTGTDAFIRSQVLPLMDYILLNAKL